MKRLHVRSNFNSRGVHSRGRFCSLGKFFLPTSLPELSKPSGRKKNRITKMLGVKNLKSGRKVKRLLNFQRAQSNDTMTC